jgi:hypothetical protein
VDGNEHVSSILVLMENNMKILTSEEDLWFPVHFMTAPGCVVDEDGNLLPGL